MKRIVLVFAAAISLAGCKTRGVTTFDLDYPDSCTEATHVRVYSILGGNCDCQCSECLAGCVGESCNLACDGNYCPIDELDRGIRLTPDEPGLYAVVYQLVRFRDDGVPEVVASACGEAVLDRDGTDSSSVSVTGSCCPFELDAGTP